MSSDHVPPHHDEEIDPGQPIAALTGFQYDPSPTFLSRMRRAIQRRTAASQVISFSWNVPALVLKEFLELLVGLFLQPADERIIRNENKTP